MAKKIVVYDTDDGSGAEPVKEFLVSDEFRIVYTDEDGYMRIAGKISNARMGTKYWIKNLFYQPVAESLCNKFDELAHILPSQILYLEDIA